MLTPSKITFQLSLMGAEYSPLGAAVPWYPPPTRRAAGGDFPRLSPTLPAGPGPGERLLGSSRVCGSGAHAWLPRGERHDTARRARAGGGSPSLPAGGGQRCSSPDERPQSPCGVGRTPPSEPTPHPEIEGCGFLRGPAQLGAHGLEQGSALGV